MTIYSIEIKEIDDENTWQFEYEIETRNLVVVSTNHDLEANYFASLLKNIMRTTDGMDKNAVEKIEFKLKS